MRSALCCSVSPISNMSVFQQQQQQLQVDVVNLMMFVVVSAATHSWTMYVALVMAIETVNASHRILLNMVKGKENEMGF